MVWYCTESSCRKIRKYCRTIPPHQYSLKHNKQQTRLILNRRLILLPILLLVSVQRHGHFAENERKPINIADNAAVHAAADDFHNQHEADEVAAAGEEGAEELHDREERIRR